MLALSHVLLLSRARLNLQAEQLLACSFGVSHHTASHDKTLSILFLAWSTLDHPRRSFVQRSLIRLSRHGWLWPLLVVASILLNPDSTPGISGLAWSIPQHSMSLVITKY